MVELESTTEDLRIVTNTHLSKRSNQKTVKNRWKILNMLDVSFDIVEQYVRFPKIERREVQKILEWIRAQPHMPNLSEGEILIFYIACQCSSEMTKQVIDTNLTCHTHVDEFFNNLDPEYAAMERAMRVDAMFILPKLTPEGHRVTIGKLIDLNASNFNFADAIKFFEWRERCAIVIKLV
uniref:Uncharacterized protein n=1 Tax=Glossina palpalis gambiensis TaxID=67801 RepID=A0A1B0B365_9MUSC